MSRTTRSGTSFSPYDLALEDILKSLPPENIIQTDISLAALLEEALASEILATEDANDEAQSDNESDADETASYQELPNLHDHPNINDHDPSPTGSTTDPDPESNRRRRQSKAKAERRRQQHQKAAATASPFNYQPNKTNDQATVLFPQKYKKKAKNKQGSSSKRRRPIRKLRRLADLLAEGCKYVKWDGEKPLLILDCEGRIIAVFVGRPDDPEWDGVISDLMAAMAHVRQDAAASGELPKGEDRHCRGNYFSFTEGVSYGGGQDQPGHLVNPPKIAELVRGLIAKKCARRVCGFQSSTLATFGPKLYQDAVADLKSLFENHGNLHHNFKNSIYPIVTFNCGPTTATYQHKDFKNRGGFWCAITSGGIFDHTKGGHLYLRQFRLVVEFPSGSTTLIPSATVDHGNTPLQPGETRCSVTQYVPGALSRWVQYGFRSGKSLLNTAEGREFKASVDGVPGERAARALSLFSKETELAADRAVVFGT
ncbi:hypothetical protein C8J57DRAFT_1515536 [Mycena rebaudengoi]|nr:hypothetical protein C8J57DRAFT_1515536 [Mycena rebaudengoi]